MTIIKFRAHRKDHMDSEIFSTDMFQKIAKNVQGFLNKQADFLSVSTAHSPRATGDAVEEILGKHFDTILGDVCAEYSANFARRAMADLAFKDNSGFYYIVDVKTHREDTKFNMPNLTSVERLSRFYEDDTNYFVLLLVKYSIEGTHVRISKVDFVPIEFLDWDCLTIGALGWGQIQIANSNNINFRFNYSRKKWMIELCDIMLEFYPKEIGKIGDRVEYFRRVRSYWIEK